MAINTCTFSGFLAKDVELKTSTTGNDFAVSSMALKNYRDAKDAPPLWLSLIAFGKLAGYFANGKKSQEIVVTGELIQETYNANGEMKTSLKLIVSDVMLPRTGAPQQQQTPSYATEPSGLF
jgi:single-strand DNA-binding protein